MSRIKVKNFLAFTPEEKLTLIRKVRTLREHALADARVKKCGGKTKSATANLIKRGKPVKDQSALILKTLKTLNPAALAKIQSMFATKETSK
jgi:hypothetical protein